MILTDIQHSSSERLSEIRESIDCISNLVPAFPVSTPRYINTLKGQVFVLFYAVIEHTLIRLITSCISYINDQGLKLIELKKSIWSMVMNAQFDSLMTATSKKWDKRWELSESIGNNINCEINNLIVPTDGRNFGPTQIESVWKTFSIDADLFHDIRFRGRLNEIILHRNKIAHGETSPSDIGNRNTITDLRDRHDEVSRFCSYCISVFEDYLVNRKYEL